VPVINLIIALIRRRDHRGRVVVTERVWRLGLSLRGSCSAMTVRTILLLLAFLCFVAAAFEVKSPINLTAAGLAFGTVALWL
jgi:hypothetical protein